MMNALKSVVILSVLLTVVVGGNSCKWGIAFGCPTTALRRAMKKNDWQGVPEKSVPSGRGLPEETVPSGRGLPEESISNQRKVESEQDNRKTATKYRSYEDVKTYLKDLYPN